MSIESQNIVSRYIQRRVLVFSLGLLALLFVITAALSRTYHAREEGLVTEWLQKGDADLASGKPGQAFQDFRNSLSYGPDNTDVQLRLAEALVADGRFNEARSYLANLWDQTPGSGEVNLDLAHVALQTGDVEQTIRYFHDAIFGSWEKDPARQRRRVRLELSEFLLAHRMTADAQTEIAGLAADTPPDDAALREQNGRLFLRVGEPGKALAEFDAAIKLDPTQSQWLAEAGLAAYQNGDYLKAETYFSAADRQNPSDEIHSSLLLVRDVLGNDPFLAGLSDEEQTRRSWRDFQQGLDRLHSCTGTASNTSSVSQPSSDLQPLNQEAQDLQTRVNLASLGQNPELRNQTMQFISRIETATANSCGPPRGLDQALALIEKRREGKNP